jgi:hypothetical protein
VVGLVPWATDPATNQPGAKVHVDVFDTTLNAWLDDGVPATADTTPSTTDASGTAWYRFSYGLQPSVMDFWVGSIANHSMSMKLRAYVQGPDHSGSVYDSAHDYALAVFDVGDATDQCMRDHQSSSGADLISACRSKANDITIFADCGHSGNMCCGLGWPATTDYQCDAGSRCDWHGRCGSCGGAGQIPCHGTQCYPLSGGGQSCHLQCDTGAYDSNTQLCAQGRANPPPPPPPPVNTRTTHDSAVNCGLQPSDVVPLFTCTVLEDPVKQGKLVSITNPFTALAHTALLVRNFSDAESVCSNPSDPSQFITLAPGQSVDLQSAIGSQPSIDGAFTYALCVLPSALDGSQAAAYISDYTESYLP